MVSRLSAPARLHRLDGAHVVQAVGQLDEDHPKILRHGHEQLAEVFGLLRLGRGQLQVGQLGDAIDQFGDLFAKQLGDLGIGGFGVFNGVVQQGGDDGGIIKLLFGQDGGDGNRMGEIGFTRLAHQPASPHR